MNQNFTYFKTIIFSFLCLQIIPLSSCNDDNSDCCVAIDVNIDIAYKTANGENLLDSSTDFAKEDIRIYYKNGEDYDYVYNNNLDHPNMHLTYTNDNDEIILRVFPSNYYEGDFSTTLVELNEQLVDTLYCEFDLSGNNQLCKTVWVNGIEMPSRSFELVR